jgi:predicted MPP superfamily phosphohydrolase
MSLFFVVFFFAYGLLHLYILLKAKNAFALNGRSSLVIVCFMLLMIIAPVIVRLSERAGLELFARGAAHVGYAWLGILFLIVCSSIGTDLYRLLVYLISFVPGLDVSRFSFSSKAYFLMALSISILISLYGYFEARQIRVERVVINTPKIPARFSPLRIAQISDVHIGLIVRHERLRRIVEEVKKVEPHLFVSTGDLVDGQINNLEGLAEILQTVNPRYGKFAITGNHEFYAGLKQAIDFTERSGFTMLRGEHATIDDFLTIVGVDDPAGSGVSKGDGAQERALLEKASSVPLARFTLLLKHRPDVEQGSLGLFDLQLSGHVHKGQIFPFRFLTRLFYPRISGFFHLPKNSDFYINRGSGTWGPPIRFLAPPEVTVIELVHAE